MSQATDAPTETDHETETDPTTTADSLQAQLVAALDIDAKTAKRAAWECWEFTLVGSHQIKVRNRSWGADADDHEYIVGVAERDGLFLPSECECPADLYNDRVCKHRAACAVAGGPPLLGAAVAYHSDDSAADPDAALAEETTLADKLGGD